jgi:hypothetical protein
MTAPDHDTRADDEPTFERPRRAVLLGAGTALTAALAGCSGGGDDETDSGGDGGDGTDSGGDGGDGTDSGGDGGDGTDSGGDGTTTGSDAGVTGSVTQNAIDGIEITDVQAQVVDDATGGSAEADVTFENTGDETITYIRRTPPYSWGVSVLDADGEVVHENSDPAVFWGEDSDDVEPGETGTIGLGASPLNDATEQAATVEITIACAEDKDNAYC